MAASQVSERFTKEREQLRKRIQDLEAENAEVKAENKALQPAKFEEREKLRNAAEIEALYGPTASRVEDKRNCLDGARRHLARFLELMRQADVGLEDPETLRAECFTLLTQTEEYMAKLHAHYHELVAH